MFLKLIQLLSRKHLIIAGLLCVGLITTGVVIAHSISEQTEPVAQVPETKEQKQEKKEVLGATIAPTSSDKQSLSKTKPATPTPTPQSSNTGSQPSNNSSSNNSSNNNSSQSTNSSSSPPTSTPQPTAESSPTATPEPTPTPTPDASPFDVSMATEGNIVTITANKPLQKCKWVEWGGPAVRSNNGDGADLISGNICTVVNIDPQDSFGVKVTSIYGEEKILGNSPPNYW